jgi:DNA-directed RNA polymerase beta subunit
MNTSKAQATESYTFPIVKVEKVLNNAPIKMAQKSGRKKAQVQMTEKEEMDFLQKKIKNITPDHHKEILDDEWENYESLDIDNSLRTLKNGEEEYDQERELEKWNKCKETNGFVLDHLGDYIEEPYTIIESYFNAQHLERLVRHQIESYNHFVTYQIQRTIQMFNPVVIHSENDYDELTKQYGLEILIRFENFKLYPPQIHENNGATKMMLPQEAKLRNFTYASNMTVDVHVEYLIRGDGGANEPESIKKMEKVLPKINIGKMPIMLKSAICVLTQNKHIDPVYMGECYMDCGGYFIIKGSEKTVLGQERAAENRIYCFDGKNTTKWSWFAEIKSVPDYKCISPKQVEMMIANKNNGFGHGIYVSIPRIKQPIELFVLFRALDVISDKSICEHILLNLDDPKQAELAECLKASIIDANKYLTKEDAFHHIVSNVAYTPINMTKEMGYLKKCDFAKDVLANDLFPHCQTTKQKLYLLGIMAKKLLQTSMGWIAPDDRDSYLNKRIELTGTLLNNLFRNYFNKLIKEMQKQIVREINSGSWRSMEDYENIINMTNIYKIMKSTTIENGINRALSTGDFSIKQSNSSKVGVAQVLSRLTYVSSLSHLRRINTPLEKSGELIAPRKLHNTTWGFLCLTGDTEVLMADRTTIKQIKYMKNGDRVISVNPSTLVEEPTYIHSFFSKMPDRLYEITTISGRKIKATANHPFLVNKDGVYQWVNLEDLKTDDKLVIRNSIKYVLDSANGLDGEDVLYLGDNTTCVSINSNDVLEHYKMDLLELDLLNKNIPLHKLKIIARLIGLLNINGDLCEHLNEGNKHYSSSFYLGEECDVLQLADDISKLGFGNPIITRNMNAHENGNGPYNKWKVSKNGAFSYLLFLLGGFALQENTNMVRSLPQWLANAEKSVKREFLSACQGVYGSPLSYEKNENIWKYTIGMLTFQRTPTRYLEDSVCYVNQIIKLFNEFEIECEINIGNIDDETTNVGIDFEKSSANLLRCGEFINYTYCEKKRRLSAPIVEHLKIIEFAKIRRDQYYKYSTKVIDDTIYENFIKNNILENGYISVPILEINEIEPELVYDFTTQHNNHSFIASSFVCHNCPAETPEGQSIGVVKNISYMAHITIPTNSSSLYEYVSPYILAVDDAKSPRELYDLVKVIVNGCWVGVTHTPVELYESMKDKKYRGIINIYTAIVFDYKFMEIRICNDGGRLTRPVLRVKNNRAIITNNVIDMLANKNLCWNDLLTNCKLNESVIEYIDPEEQNYSMIALKNREEYLQNGEEMKIRYTHCEIHPSTIFGVLASCIPFPEHNQAPRNTYQTAMGKQAIGVYATNYDQRMDKTAYVLSYPSRPLVDTRLMNFIHLKRIPSGCQIHVAIMTHTGYNQEDSVLVNQGSIDRGLFMATIYHTEKDEDKNVIRDEIIRCKPDSSKTKGIKFGNYEKLNSNGFIPENTLVENRDVIIAKIVPIKENRNDLTKKIKYEDQSKIYRTNEESYIDKNYTGRNGDGYNFAKVRVRTLRKPVLGDKFCALPTQEVLTDAGWVQIKDIDPDVHRVCTLDANGKMCYEYPSAKFEYDHDSIDGTDEPLYSVKNKQVEVVCTMNHKLYVQTRPMYNKKLGYTLIEARNVMGKQVRFQKTMENVYPDKETILIGDVEYNMDAWLQLLGMFISDGCSDISNKSIFITAIKERKHKFIHEICNNLNIEYTIHKDGNKRISGSKYPSVYNELSKLSVGALNKHLPDYVWDLSQRQSKILIEALLQGDGNTMQYNGEDGFSRYGTISIRLANDICRLCLHAGWSGIIKDAGKADGTTRTGKRNLGSRAGQEVSITQKHDYYKVSIIREQNQPWINKKKNDANVETTVPYKGKVYCIEMPTSHVYYMRESMQSPCLIVGNSSRHGQKGTCGNIIPECYMPYTKDGVKPDIIINPHAIPSRMTIAQLKETLLGKVLLELGMFGDGTSFGNLTIKTITQELQKVGYESYGNEVMYNAMTGEQLETSIFIGPVFYQRLKHMVSDKQHSRAYGPTVNLTRQPAEGRSRDGGFRVGEMERDCLIAHGMSRFCRERLFEVSDKYSTVVCKKCGMISAFNNGTFINKQYFSVHHCKTCDNKTEFAKVEVPYAFKLMSQELQTINIVPRLLTEE